MSANSPWRWAPALALLCNATVWGLAWLPFKALHTLGLHPLWSTAGIFTGALAALLIWRPRNLLVFGQHPRLLLLAVAAGLTNVCFTWAITIGDVVRVTLLFYMMPVWSIFLAWLMIDERPTVLSFMRLGLALLGVVLVLRQPDMVFPWPQGLADWLALAGGFCFALNNVLLRRWRDAPEQGRALAMFVGGVSMSLLLAVSGAADALPAFQWMMLPWLLVLSLGFLCGNLGLQYGAARLSAQATALIMLSEIVIATISSIALGAAQLSPAVALGGTLIVLAAALSILRR